MIKPGSRINPAIAASIQRNASLRKTHRRFIFHDLPAVDGEGRYGIVDLLPVGVTEMKLDLRCPVSHGETEDVSRQLLATFITLDRYHSYLLYLLMPDLQSGTLQG